MNKPPYYLSDVFGEVVEQVRVALGLPLLNYRCVDVDELNELLKKLGEEVSAPTTENKFPFIWLVQPFTWDRNVSTHLYGKTLVRVLVMNKSNKEDGAAKRLEDNFKPHLTPIYLELMEQLNNHPAISYEMAGRDHEATDRNWWDEQQNIIQDIVDIIDITELDISIHNNENCTV